MKYRDHVRQADFASYRFQLAVRSVPVIDFKIDIED